MQVKSGTIRDRQARDARPAQSDSTLLSVGWGALWGPALGFWFLAPSLAETHRIMPEHFGHWMVLFAALTAIFSTLGAVLGFVGGLVLSAIELLFTGPFNDRRWAYGLFGGVCIAGAYALQSITTQLLTYGLSGIAPRQVAEVTVFAAMCGVATGGLAALYRLAADTRRSTAFLVCTLVALSVSGALALARQAPATTQPAVEVGPLQADSAMTNDVPLVFIGLDGGAWRVLKPAMENGHAPTLRRLAQKGITGNMQALWPPYYWSAAAWGAIVTGMPRDVTGIYEDLAASAPGLPLFQAPLGSVLRLNPLLSVRSLLVESGMVSLIPPPRPLLKAKPIWQLLHEAGVRAAVVRFQFTYPPQEQAAVVVSDWVGRDVWETLGVTRQPVVTPVVPENKAATLLAPFRLEGRVDPSLFARVLSGARPASTFDVPLDPFLVLEVASDIDTRTFNVSERIVGDDPRLPFLAIYISGLDAVQHAFWQYRFPGDFSDSPFRPAQVDVDRLGGVPDQYIRFLDERLRYLLSLYETEPNVLIASDHGFTSAKGYSAWRGWHSDEGIFILSGPSVREIRSSVPVAYYDVAPTIAHLKGFRPPPGVNGKSVVSEAAEVRRD